MSLTYNSANPFIGANLKIERAKEHLRDLARLAAELPLKRNYHLVISLEPDQGKMEIIYIRVNRMPMQFATLMGDAIHNIRSALDHVAVAISCPPFGTGNPKSIYFPTGIDRAKYILERDSKMKGAGAVALDLVDHLEPYGGGQHSIRPLHDLDILDKHKLLIPTVSLLSVEKWEAMIGNKLVTLGRADFKPTADGANFTARIDVPVGTTSDDLKVPGDFHPSFEIVFDKDQPLQGQAIVVTLTKLRDVVQRFIQTCEAHFL